MTKNKRYHVYANPGTARERVFVSEHDTFKDAREMALDVVHFRGIPAIVIDTEKANAVFPYAPIIMGIPLPR
jgi:hypothetical protein